MNEHVHALLESDDARVAAAALREHAAATRVHAGRKDINAPRARRMLDDATACERVAKALEDAR